MAHVTLFLSQKGGVGKSTLCVNFAAINAHILGGIDGETAPVAAGSIDPQGSAVWWSERVGDGLPFEFFDASTNLRALRHLRQIPGKQIIAMDTPGWLDMNADDDAIDPLGEGPAADALRAVLDSADDIIVPMAPEPLAFQPTANTIERVIKPRGIPYGVVINNWDPRDGTVDLDQTRAFVRAKGWPLYRTVVRHYKLHTRASADGTVCTQYKPSRTSAEAMKDFMSLALEHQLRRQAIATGAAGDLPADTPSDTAGELAHTSAAAVGGGA